jgi:hypothetical protein
VRIVKRIYVLLALIILSAAGSASAQTEAELRQYFEGRRVYLKIDMPATKDGVNVYAERARPFDYGNYAAKLRRHGTSLRRGDTAMVTKVKVKGKHIEFQLDGGGYGVMGDESPGVFAPVAGKSRREKRLEEWLKREEDPHRRRRLREEIDGLRREREREDSMNRAIAEQAEEAQRARIEEKALRAGSRFNIHFEAAPSGEALTPEALMRALEEYVEFDDSEYSAEFDSDPEGSIGSKL